MKICKIKYVITEVVIKILIKLVATYANELRFGQSNNSATNLTIELLTTGKVKGITDVLKNVIPWLVMLGIAAVIILCKIV